MEFCLSSCKNPTTLVLVKFNFFFVKTTQNYAYENRVDKVGI